ncbi:unnamed protein product [Vitrella brassicaformis CCMP3155]|uniref:Uncharacterized protein n=1 Tax=Vitrella brassicaformis (strain CCMP3155) TaxID=1169540 RepID=A0A0G4E845_VITBC|nr:unnamed protein product [Vitrella brassicaformis CCMP3155]|eukprot:CEL91583.1 unnamed protein product [Vitrella brassicaformis CCMP3155]
MRRANEVRVRTWRRRGIGLTSIRRRNACTHVYTTARRRSSATMTGVPLSASIAIRSSAAVRDLRCAMILLAGSRLRLHSWRVSCWSSVYCIVMGADLTWTL